MRYGNATTNWLSIAQNEAELTQDQQIEDAEAFLQSGRFPESELVIGVVGALGADLGKVALDLESCLRSYKYDVQQVRV